MTMVAKALEFHVKYRPIVRAILTAEQQALFDGNVAAATGRPSN